MTRRSFCFLFGAGMVGALVPIDVGPSIGTISGYWDPTGTLSHVAAAQEAYFKEMAPLIVDYEREISRQLNEAIACLPEAQRRKLIVGPISRQIIDGFDQFISVPTGHSRSRR